MALTQRLWWQDGVIYQIYPRSFQDSNGDGIGDLPGIEARLDYLVELGVDALWISPFYPSPMADFGYDVADYTGVDPIFGTMDDFDRLIAAAHRKGLRLIVDFVPNHSSDQHPWFVESRSSRGNAKRDWYLWRDPAADGGVPNNWMSHFGGSAWEWDQVTGQFYLHSFLREQPDLNWWNPEVRSAVFAAMRFWLDRGVDGFRMDVLWLLIKDDQFRSNPQNRDWQPGGNSYGSVDPIYTSDRPETHAIVREMRDLMNGYPERVLIGEIYLPLTRLVTYYGPDPNTTAGRGADLPFNFHLIQTAWDAAKIARLIEEYEALLPPGAWPNWVLETTISRVWPPASAPGRSAWRPCCCSPCAARRPCITAMSWECRTRRSGPTRCGIRRSCGSRASAWAAIPSARRWCGTGRPARVSPPARRGCRWCATSPH